MHRGPPAEILGGHGPSAPCSVRHVCNHGFSWMVVWARSLWSGAGVQSMRIMSKSQLGSPRTAASLCAGGWRVDTSTRLCLLSPAPAATAAAAAAGQWRWCGVLDDNDGDARGVIHIVQTDRTAGWSVCLSCFYLLSVVNLTHGLLYASYNRFLNYVLSSFWTRKAGPKKPVFLLLVSVLPGPKNS